MEYVMWCFISRKYVVYILLIVIRLSYSLERWTFQVYNKVCNFYYLLNVGRGI